MRFDLAKINQLLLTLKLDAIISRPQAQFAIRKAFGCTEITSCRWLERALRFKMVEFNSDRTGFQLVDQQAAQEKRERQDIFQAAVDSGKVVRLSSARCARNRARLEAGLQLM